MNVAGPKGSRKGRRVKMSQKVLPGTEIEYCSKSLISPYDFRTRGLYQYKIDRHKAKEAEEAGWIIEWLKRRYAYVVKPRSL